MLCRRVLYVCFLAVLAAEGCTQAERGETGEVELGGSLSAFSVRVGDCLNDWEEVEVASEISNVEALPCAEAHDNQAYAVFYLPEGQWPGTGQIFELADRGCLDRFRLAIGVDYADSVLDITSLTPTEESWVRRSDREVVCLAFHMEREKLYGSVLNSGM